VREHDFDFTMPERRRGKRRFDDDEPRPNRRGRLTEEARGLLAQQRTDAEEGDPLPEGADRWSTWGNGDLGPEPRPDWVITDAAAVDHELGPDHAAGRQAVPQQRPPHVPPRRRLHGGPPDAAVP
jgi:RIO kinase 1